MEPRPRHARAQTAVAGLLLLAAFSMAPAWGRKPPKEEEVKVTLRPLSASEAMDILHQFPEMVPSDMASKANDTSYLTSVFDFSEVTAAPLERDFPAVRFYKCLNTESPFARSPYLIAVVGNRRSTLPGGYGQLLYDCGLKATDRNMIELARAFVLLAAGFHTVYLDDERGREVDGITFFPPVAFMDAQRVSKTLDGTSFDARLKVRVGKRIEEWYFQIRHDQFGAVERRADAGQLIKQYDLLQAEPSPKR
jgi:hypothetical protein